MFPFTERARFTRLQRMLRQVGLTLHHCPEDSQRFAELGRYYVTEDGSVCAKDVNLGVWIKEGKTPDQLTFAWLRAERERRGLAINALVVMAIEAAMAAATTREVQ